MVQTLILSLLIIAIGVVFMAIKVIVKKGGRFESQHVHDSKALRDKGIHCVMDQDREARQQNKAY